MQCIILFVCYDCVCSLKVRVDAFFFWSRSLVSLCELCKMDVTEQNYLCEEVKLWPNEKKFRPLPQNRILQILRCKIIVGNKLNNRFLLTLCDNILYTQTDFCVFGCVYRCRDRKCPARLLVLPNGQCVRIDTQKTHKCSSNWTQDITNWAALNAMKKKCADLQNIASGKRLAKVKDIYTE